MTMGWGNSFDDHSGKAIAERQAEDKETLKFKFPNSPALEQAISELDKYRYTNTQPQDDTKLDIDFGLMPLGIGIDLGAGDSQTVLTTWENGEIKQRIIPPEELYNNLKPTHDPYTNPNAHIYYECNCGAILDPKTKSFAALNNHASTKGWKIRFGERGYTPYCVKCGEGVE